MIHFLRQLDHRLFFSINRLARRNAILDVLGIVAAYPLLIVECMGVVFAAFFLFSPGRFELFILHGVISITFGFVLNFFIGFLVRRHRPLDVLPNVQSLLHPYTHWKSFPSDHSMVAWTVVMILFLNAVSAGWIYIFILFAVLVSLGRIFVGVHYPSDVLAGAIVGLIATLLGWYSLVSI